MNHFKLGDKVFFLKGNRVTTEPITGIVEINGNIYYCMEKLNTGNINVYRDFRLASGVFATKEELIKSL